ncbi:LacI family DNA-binding transcriptional regulator [Bacillus sp. 03113]|uniref:LacI family DNA-binding transcriptional regulator n=1 Tax=Bacillus sp. 03113 TaxID=2578211 RepID=UPI0015E8A2CC|nr:LacI family DNA-binding transcriptional regulator [Bacillus sp. 03113]
MKVTLKDIAEKTNVSISTVSRVLNNQPTSVDQLKINDILTLAQDLGYKKTRNIPQKDEKISGMKFGCVLYNMKRKYYDPYFSEIIYGIERELLDHGHILSVTYDTNELLQSNFALEEENLALICVGTMDAEILDRLSGLAPVISAGGLQSGHIDCVTVDFFQASYHAVTTLIKKGHKDIAFIGSSIADSNIPLEQEGRFLGYQEALKKSGISLVPEWVQDGNFDITEGCTAMSRILQHHKRPTAVFIASDRMAYGAYRAIQEAGLTIPDDIAIIAFDNLEMSSFMTPPLTTVHVHKEEMGRLAVRMLLQKIQYHTSLPLMTFVPTELIVRNSYGSL